jgi:hypothetical protein
MWTCILHYFICISFTKLMLYEIMIWKISLFFCIKYNLERLQLHTNTHSKLDSTNGLILENAVHWINLFQTSTTKYILHDLELSQLGKIYSICVLILYALLSVLQEALSNNKISDNPHKNGITGTHYCPTLQSRKIPLSATWKLLNMESIYHTVNHPYVSFTKLLIRFPRSFVLRVRVKVVTLV